MAEKGGLSRTDIVLGTPIPLFATEYVNWGSDQGESLVSLDLMYVSLSGPDNNVTRMKTAFL